jgi:hypothetical protein
MNENEIKKIVEELCAGDKTLQGKERELIVLVQALALKPQVESDADFKRTLRVQLIAALVTRDAEKRTAVNKRGIDRSFLRRWSVAFSGVAVIVIALAGWLSFSAFRPHTDGNNSLALLSTGTITKVGDRAFGQISSKVSVSPRAVTLKTTANAPTVEPSMMGISAVSMSERVLSPTVIKYVYKGSAFSQNDATVDVLKKATSTLSLGDIVPVLGQAGLGSFGTSSFDNAAVTNLTFSQNEAFGYTVTVDLLNGRVSIDPAIGQWPVENVTVPKTLSSSSVLAIANRFLEDHAIKIANYGEPEVRDGASVFYPKTVNGEEVYSMSGEKIGLTVNVNVHYQRVESMYGLDVQNYEASSYGAVVDAAKIISHAEQESGSESGAIIQERGLGTPVRAYADDGNGLLIPAFVFPIISDGTDTAGSVIIVSLVDN